MSYKGRFKPNNPSKYRGDPTKIIYRSSWELKVFRVCDMNPDVIWWQSEEVVIRYVSPIDNKVHRYFPDIVMCKKVPTGEQQVLMIEIKPHKQTLPPDPANRNKTKTGRVSRRYLNEVKTYGVNEAKWAAAREYCKQKGWHFITMTEKDIL